VETPTIETNQETSERELSPQEETQLVIGDLAGFFDLLAMYDFEDSKKLALETTTPLSETEVVISDANQTKNILDKSLH
jgi:hypothetical protein